MEPTAIIVYSISFILTGFYLLLMAFYRRGWKQIPECEDEKNGANIFITVIIPARNEEATIITCLEAVYAQQYPKDLFEVVVADDHSDDATPDVVLKFKSEKNWENLSLLELKKIPGKQYKKAAITEAVKNARGEIIITTDADCTMGKNWLGATASFMQQNNAALASGPVVFDWDPHKFTRVQNFFLRLVQLEFAGLVCIGGASIQLKVPSMCNGANLAYRKDIFEIVQGYMGNDNLLSGDDEFLMHKVYKQYPERVFFFKSREAIVKTPPPFSLGSFINQRMRWVSKSTHYADKRITFILAMSWLFNLSLAVSLIVGFWSPLLLAVFWIVIKLKLLIEFWFYAPILNFLNIKKLKWYFIFAQAFHITYVVIIGLLGNFGKYNWKGRKQ